MTDKSTPLRRGWTTGACATAAATACAQALRSGTFTDSVTITLPKGDTPTFTLHTMTFGPDQVTASIIKDAGDDPDVTHGAEIVVTVSPGPSGQGVRFQAGDGVGTVTLPGLVLPVGEPAINPGPRAMMIDNLKALYDGIEPDLTVTVAIPGGQDMALKTMNGRLGIKGGLSVLGTTGIVIPYSCSAWIHAIHRGVDVACALGLDHLLAATGKTSESTLVKEHADLDEAALIDMGDFAGGLLKYLRKHPVKRLTIAGGPAKLAKLGQGHMDLHSSRSAIDLEKLGGGNADVTASNTVLEALSHKPELADVIAKQAREVARATADSVDIDIIVVGRDGSVLARAG